MPGAYYNEIDPYAAQWLRNLIAAGHIAPGDVDERSIVDVRADDLRGYRQCHFFAGIGIWSHALRLAGWPDDEPVWTGSCPCQPFSTAGQGKGHEDERHLWPTWFGLIRESRPVACFGEQVADGDGYAWLDDVGHDLEGIGYALGALCPAACGFGAPHERQRLYFVADPTEQGRRPQPERDGGADGRPAAQLGRLRDVGELAHSDGRDASAEGLQRGGQHGQQPQDSGASDRMADAPDARRDRRAHAGAARGTPSTSHSEGHQPARGSKPEREGAAGGMGDAISSRLEVRPRAKNGRRSIRGERTPTAPPGVVGGFWSNAQLVYCADDRWRPVEPGTFPLAHGATARVGRLRAYGNAIVAPVAAEFIRAYRDASEAGLT